MGINPARINSDDCVSAFGRMFWAFLFFFDFRVGINNVEVDLLPDFIGWILIATALSRIDDLSPKVRGVRRLTLWLILLSLFDFVRIRITLSESGGFSRWMVPSFPIAAVVEILEMIAIWRLCGLIIDIAEAAGEPSISGKAAFRRNLYIGFRIATLASIPVAFIAPEIVVIAVLIGLPLAFIVACLMMGLMRTTENMCRSYQAP